MTKLEKSTKKAPGRPKLTEDEKKLKAEKKLQEEIKKKNRKKERKTDISEIVETTKLKILENPEKLAVNKGIENAIQEIKENELDFQILENETLGIEQVSEIYEQQTKVLTDRIVDLEEEVLTIQSRLKKLGSISEKLEIERKLIKELNRYEQNFIYQEEKNLIEIDGQNFEYQADSLVPDWIIEILQKVTKKRNERLILQKISDYNYKIQNRSEQLIKLDTELADITLVIIYNNNLFETLKILVNDYRNVRFDIGQDFRNLRDFIKQNRLKVNGSKILESFSNNLSKINQVGNDFRAIMTNSSQFVSTKFNEFDQYQKGLLLKSDSDEVQTLQTQAVEFDSILSNLLLFKKQNNEKK